MQRTESLQGGREIKIRGLADIIFETYPNKNMDLAAELTKKLFKKAEKNIKIVSGCLIHEFYEDLGVAESLKEIAERNGNGKKVDIEIISGPVVDKQSKKILELSKSGMVKLYKAMNYPEKHFIMVDDKHVRAEVSHSAEEISETKGYSLYNTIFLAKRLALEFEKLKKESVLLYKGDIKPRDQKNPVAG